MHYALLTFVFSLNSHHQSNSLRSWAPLIIVISRLQYFFSSALLFIFCFLLQLNHVLFNFKQAVDFAKFEEDFKLGINRAKTDMVDAASPNANNNRKMSKKPELLSLMDANRNRNASIGKCKRHGCIKSRTINQKCGQSCGVNH